MSFDSLLNHTCDIYHIQKADMSPGYGIRPSPVFSYPDKPDLRAARCHFGGGAAAVTQKSPQTAYEARLKLSLPAGTDVRVNDKIIDLSTGYEYTAEVPRDIRGHHISVFVRRTARQEAL